MVRYVLGIDAGGSHTRCQISDERGRVVSMGCGGPANTNFISPKGARKSVESAILEALSTFGHKVEKSVYTGPHLPTLLSRGISSKIALKNSLYINEFEAALAAGLRRAGGWGVVILSGTGSFCRGRNAAGEEKYVGGWGPAIGDEGSGYDLAGEALVAAVKASDGRGRQTMLTELISSHMRLSRLDELKGRLYRPQIKRHVFAGVAACVFAAADEGDYVATEILHSGGIRLAQLALPVLDRLFDSDDTFPVILSGGILSRPSVMTATLISVIKKVRPRADVFASSFQPVTGTIIVGLDSLGVRITGQVIKNLEKGNLMMSGRGKESKRK